VGLKDCQSVARLARPMRDLCLLLVLATGSFAWSAGAQTGQDATALRPRIVARPQAVPTVAPDSAESKATPKSTTVLRSMTRPGQFVRGSTPSQQDARACRQTCAQTYYFCAAGQAAIECPGSWSRCAAGCEAADLTGGVAPPRP
jgi:hypothetical protein